MTAPIDARALWRRFEAVHAVTYFAEESRAAASAAGLRGFWMGYFGFRAAPLGEVGAEAVVALFANFAPARVRRALPDAWSFADPGSLLEVRSASAAAALRRACPDVDDLAEALVPDLGAVGCAGDPTGRPLFAANLGADVPEDPVAELWHWCTVLREHRGDGHVAALVGEGVSGLQSHLLQVASGAVPGDRLREARGWTDQEWDEASATLGAAGVLAADGALTAQGQDLKRRIEEVTDRLAADPWAVIGERVPDVTQRLSRVAAAVRDRGMLPVPNPIGLD